MSARFYLANERSITPGGEEVIERGVLFFEFKERDQDSTNRANADHVNRFPEEYGKFMELNPGYVLPFSTEGQPIGSTQIPEGEETEEEPLEPEIDEPDEIEEPEIDQPDVIDEPVIEPYRIDQPDKIEKPVNETNRPYRSNLK